MSCVLAWASPALADTYFTDGTAAPFDRQATVEWAKVHAQDSQPFGAACTWFVSQALWAGGMQSDDTWNPNNEHGFLRKRPGTVEATAAQPLVDYLLRRYPASQRIEMNFASNAVPEAVPGDVVAYDWGGDGSIDHLALIVDIAPGSYPEVAEWGTGNPAGYQKRGWTWSENSKTWLQAKKPNVQAELIHIDTTNVTTY